MNFAPGVELVLKSQGIATVKVSDPYKKNGLSWDRFVRLKAAAAAVLKTDAKTIPDELAKHLFAGSVNPHTSIAAWLDQYVTLNLAPDAERELNQHLVENYADEPCSRALYHLVVCDRCSISH